MFKSTRSTIIQIFKLFMGRGHWERSQSLQMLPVRYFPRGEHPLMEARLLDSMGRCILTQHKEITLQDFMKQVQLSIILSLCREDPRPQHSDFPLVTCATNLFTLIPNTPGIQPTLILPTNSPQNGLEMPT